MKATAPHNKATTTSIMEAAHSARVSTPNMHTAATEMGTEKMEVSVPKALAADYKAEAKACRRPVPTVPAIIIVETISRAPTTTITDSRDKVVIVRASTTKREKPVAVINHAPTTDSPDKAVIVHASTIRRGAISLAKVVISPARVVIVRETTISKAAINHAPTTDSPDKAATTTTAVIRPVATINREATIKVAIVRAPRAMIPTPNTA